tara:strand:- start:2343 stop:3374 length:1032 start_codon:yes stop_codon:yes gene_type:complete
MAHRPFVQKWWKQNESTFLFPPAYPSHEHQWTKLEVDCVACQLCGIVHICDSSKNIVPCCLEVQDDSSLVCTLTGLVAKTSSFFSDCISTRDYRISSISAHDRTPVTCKTQEKTNVEKIEIIRTHAENMLRHLLYSKGTEESRKRETMRICKKVQNAFSMRCSEMVSNRSSHGAICIMEALESSLETYAHFDRGNTQASVPEFDYWEFLISHICLVLTSITLPKQFAITPKNENLKNLILSFIYMTKNGLVVDEITYIPKINIMAQLLPLEVHMWNCFKLQPKSITEVSWCCHRDTLFKSDLALSQGENLLKRCINAMTNKQKEGFASALYEPNRRKRKHCDC